MGRFASVAWVIVLLLVACSGGGSTDASPEASVAAEEPPGRPPQMTDDTLGVEVVTAGLTQPTALAFIGDNEFFVTEKSTGQVHRVVDGEVGEPVVDLAVNFYDERGLLGIALHPQFSENGFVYLYWTTNGQGTNAFFGADTDDEFALPELGNRVDRFRWDGSALVFNQSIVRMRSNTLETDTSGRIRGNHDAGPLVFGADGKLYIINGDQNLRAQLQNITGGAAPDDANLAGVVLRLNDDGSIPEDNPFHAAGAEMGGEAGQNIQMIWAYGIRNSFGLAVHPDTGALWQTENGDDSWDEVNILPAGANSGWWQLMGPSERFDEYRQIELDSEDGLDHPDYPPDRLAESAEEAQSRSFAIPGSSYVEPVFSWKYPPAVTSLAFVTGDSLGETSANTAWMGTVLTDSLYRYPLAEDGSGFDFPADGGLDDLVDDNTAKGDVGESADYVVGTGFGVVTHIANGPDGFLYVLSHTAGVVYRIGPGDQVGGQGGEGGEGGPTASPPTGGTGEVVEITVGTDEGTELLFDPTEISVPAGATVRLTFVNESTVPHNLTFGDPINAATATIVDAGAEETIEFVAPEAGEYTYVCTLHPGMEGTLVVEG